MSGGLDEIRALIAEELDRPVDAAVGTVADEARRRHDGVAAVLFYGSCLRQGQQDGVLDFYLLVDRLRDAYTRRLPALANALLPPNVFYIEVPVGDRLLRAKYAVMSVTQFRRGTARSSLQSSLWARFSQPARLIYARDGAVRGTVVDAVSEAVVAMVEQAAPLLDPPFGAAELWVRAFQETYRAELRTEGPDRARQIYDSDRERYERLTPWALRATGEGWTETAGGAQFSPSPGRPDNARRMQRRWRARRIAGKLFNLLRLAKAVFTFEGGMDYILWKIERHSGVRATATPWQRRHPLLASPLLAWRLYRKGAFR